MCTHVHTHQVEELASVILREEVHNDAFSVYWRDTIINLILQKVPPLHTHTHPQTDGY